MIEDPLSRTADRVRLRAAGLAGRFASTARSSATSAQERAILRMIGVDGLDRDGHPLAGSVVDLYNGAARESLARGVILPFSTALLEYDLAPRELALEVASRVVDLTLEAEVLERPDRLKSAQKNATRLLRAALERVDANRTAARDMRHVLGQACEPWLGVVLHALEVEGAADEIRCLVGDGVDVVQVRVPASWEYAQARRKAGMELPWLFDESAGGKGRAGQAGGSGAAAGRKPGSASFPLRRTEGDRVPAGSQRGLAALRRAADDAAAARSCYAGLMTVSSAFAAPEQAVVAAFERIDLIEADPIREIVEDNVEPARALADHAFAHRLHARAGSMVILGAGPLALGADVASGVPADAATQAGRALALQALGVEMALADGLPSDRMLLGAVPRWIEHEADPRAILVSSWLRGVVFPGMRLWLEEPQSDRPLGVRTAALIAALSGAGASMVIRDRDACPVSDSVSELRAATAAGAAYRSALSDGSLHGDAAELARRTLAAADATLELLEGEGWESLLGPGASTLDADGGTGVVERSADLASGAGLLDDLLKR